MPPERRIPPSIDDEVCGYCPSRLFAPGAFDVAPRPDRAWPWIRGEGRRVDARTGVGVCVHPHKVRLPVGRWGSEGRLPDLSGWDLAAEAEAAEADRAGGAPDGAALEVTPTPRRSAPRRAAPAEPTSAEPAPVEPAPPRERRRWWQRALPRPAGRSGRRSPCGPYAPSAAGPSLPDVPRDAGRLAEWMCEVVSGATPDTLADVLDAAERAAAGVHEPTVVVAALRRAMGSATSDSRVTVDPVSGSRDKVPSKITKS
ncbi:hypothetical protein [Embleya hyalina]|uniref:Uncharacterized protein n=1 Tax=Embleya hyalina TaxID=516124 RepID=A0A401YLS4_9ACTN|nr:hypothetical protein [Embleya hyalina]GCD95541.1 hypothetical protein EHYA_03215 [Embleya hyalina]